MAQYDCIIVGGGPAGMMAALQLSRSGLKPIIIEKNKLLGRKLRITGKGRCNITNRCDRDTLFANICSGGKFLYSSLSRFSNLDLIDFFESNGLKTVTERGERVFPESQKAYDVAELFVKLLKEQKVPVLYDAKVTDIISNNGHATGVKLIVGGKMQQFYADNILIATGGITYPLTGSTGDGYELAKKQGHTVIDPKPALCALKCHEKSICKELEGLSLKNVSIRILRAGKAVYDDFGEMLFTENGVSGPIILSASRHIPEDAKDLDYKIIIDLKPALDYCKLDARLVRDFAENPKKLIKNYIPSLVPGKMADVFIKLVKLDPEAPVYTIGKDLRKSISEGLKNFTLNIEGLDGIEHAVITAGGINLTEINPKTLESKKLTGLYFAGEVMDIDAYTGGFNLTLAFSTGAIAGIEISNKILYNK